MSTFPYDIVMLFDNHLSTCAHGTVTLAVFFAMIMTQFLYFETSSWW